MLLLTTSNCHLRGMDSGTCMLRITTLKGHMCGLDAGEGYILSASASQERWPEVEAVMRSVVASFEV